MPLLVFQIEDDWLWSDITRKALANRHSYKYLGCATTADSGLALVERNAVDLVILDLILPDLDSLEIIDKLGHLAKRPKLLLLTCRSDEATLFRAWTSENVVGMLWKSVHITDQLALAMQAIIEGKRYFPSEVINEIMRLRSSPNAFHKILSDSELRMLPKLGSGVSDDEIAKEFGMSPSTVHYHRQSIMRKFNLHRLVDLMQWSVSKGFLSLRSVRKSDN